MTKLFISKTKLSNLTTEMAQNGILTFLQQYAASVGSKVNSGCLLPTLHNLISVQTGEVQVDLEWPVLMAFATQSLTKRSSKLKVFVSFFLSLDIT